MKKTFQKGTRFLSELVQTHGVAIFSFLLGALFAVLICMLPQMFRENSKMEELEYLIDTYFVEEPDMEALRDGAADGMVAALGDRWSHYLTAEEYLSNTQSMNSEYVGVGITIRLLEDQSGYEILKVATDGPADKAGILSGDILVAADGQYASKIGANALQTAVAGPKGTDVELTVLREGKELTFTVTRDTVRVTVTEGTMLDGQIGLVTITSFKKHSAEETLAVIEELLAEGAEALIFDVRNNPGGYTTELIEVLDYLLPEGPVFRTLSYAGKESIEYSDAEFLDLPMAVLINGDSYSAAESFAAALQEYEAAVVVGEQTCGKGYYQNTYQLSDGSGLTLSTGKYFTPNGNSLIGVGVVPDLPSPMDQETAALLLAERLDPMEDPQIITAIDWIKVDLNLD